MSKIVDENRDYDIRTRLYLIDTYEWEVDKQGNHRLIHRETDNASNWIQSNQYSVLNDRIIFPEFFMGTGVPVKMLIKWEVSFPLDKLTKDK